MLATKSTLRCDTPRRWNLTRAALIAALFRAIPAAAAESECALGAQRLSDGSVIDVAAASAGALRWRGLEGGSGEWKRGGDRSTGTAGWTGPTGGLRSDERRGGREWSSQVGSPGVAEPQKKKKKK